MTIFEYLRNSTPAEIKANGYKLPDIDIEKGEKWVPGAYEGILLRSDMGFKYHAMVNYFTAKKIKKQVLKPSETRKKKLLSRLEKYSAISIVDPICSFCVAFKLTKSEEKKAALREFAIDLITNVNKREIVKLGIALLGICGRKEDLELIKPLGLHDEFTLYVSGTACRLSEGDEKNKFLFELLENVSGWGKIAVLFDIDYTKEEARLKVVKCGCKNDIAYSYAANVCAIKGKMHEILKQMSENKFPEEEEKAIFSGVCDIFMGLINAKERQDGLSEYPYARESAVLFSQICQDKPYLTDNSDKKQKILDGIKFII